MGILHIVHSIIDGVEEVTLLYLTNRGDVPRNVDRNSPQGLLLLSAPECWRCEISRLSEALAKD